MSLANISKTQEASDRFYAQHGPCCAGCDWWHNSSALIGECRKSAPVAAEQRYGMVKMDRISWQLREQDAGHILTNRDHLCGDFKDEYDWSSLPPHYLRRIGKVNARLGNLPPTPSLWSEQ